MWLARCRSFEPFVPEANVRKVWRPTWIATYAPANSRARSPHAEGIAIDINRLPSITPITSPRTAGALVSSSFVAQVV